MKFPVLWCLVEHFVECTDITLIWVVCWLLVVYWQFLRPQHCTTVWINDRESSLGYFYFLVIASFLGESEREIQNMDLNKSLSYLPSPHDGVSQSADTTAHQWIWKWKVSPLVYWCNKYMLRILNNFLVWLKDSLLFSMS